MGTRPPDLKEGQCSVQWAPYGGLWLSSATHAVLHIHEAQALPPFPLLGHLS